MRHLRTALLGAAAAVAAVTLVAGQASAGGPTSVLIVNPTTGAASGIYVTDSDYDLLLGALDPRPGKIQESVNLSAGPGTSAINITWLVHDVSVWRIDHVRLDLAGDILVQTRSPVGAEPGVLTGGEWHVAGDGKTLVDILWRHGIIGDAAAEMATDRAATGAAHGDTAGTVPDHDAAREAIDDGLLPGGWWWALPGAAFGAALGWWRPGVAWISRRRVTGPRIELVDA